MQRLTLPLILLMTGWPMLRAVINPGKCMQIELNADPAYGKRSNIDIQDCNGSAAQQFLIQE